MHLLQERKFSGGSGQISECMARELGDSVKLQSPVCRIDQNGDLVTVETVDKKTYMVSISQIYYLYIKYSYNSQNTFI